MAVTAAAGGQVLSNEQLVDVLALLPNSDSVELKLTVPESHHRSTLFALGVDPLEAQIRLVVFFDTPDLRLERAGVVVRARRIQGKGDDSVVKLRPVVPSQLPEQVRGAPGFTVEVDALPGGFVCSGTMKRAVDRDSKAVKSVLQGRSPIRKLFGKRQRAFFAEHAPDGLELDDLSILGPLFVLKLRLEPPELGTRLVTEMWLYPDGSRILELSAKTSPDGAFDLAARMRAYLAGRGVDLSGQQQTKTRKALEFFAGDLAPKDEHPRAREIVPRWEWRTFAPSLALPAGSENVIEPGPVQESAEVYLLSRHADQSLKVRASVMDVKLLERVDNNGLEQWRPVLKGALPLSGEDSATVRAALGLPEGAEAEVRDVEGLLGLLGREDVTAVRVQKTRRRYSGAGCAVELTTITTRDAAIETVAVESEDPAAVVALVERLGFPLRPNVNMSKGLKELTGFGGERYAAIDVGTNSVKFHLGERTAEGTWNPVVDRAEITRLGEGLEGSGQLQPEPMRRTAEAIAGMVEEARAKGAIEIVAVGTAGMRIASNSAELVRMVREQSGIVVDVISGEEESRLAYLAVRAGVGLDGNSVVVFDTGGGSSQFTFGHGDDVDERFSIDVGAVRFTERFRLDQAVSEETLGEALVEIGADFGRLDERPRPDAMIGLGGVVTNLAAVKHALATYDPDVVQGTVLDSAEIDRQIDLYRRGDADARRAIVGLQPKRAEVMLAGALIVRTAMGKLGRDSLVVSDRGLRHGLLLDRFGGKPRDGE